MSPIAMATRPTTMQSAEPDPTTTPAKGTSRNWTVTTAEGLTLTGYQPAWSMDDPSRTDMPLDQALPYLRGYAHYTILATEPLLPRTDTDGTLSEEWTKWTFIAQIECHPYSDQPHEHTPTANLAIVEDYEIGGLDPTDLTRIATQLRAQADLFEHTVRPTLIAARTDWTTHHPQIRGSASSTPANSADVQIGGVP